MRELDYYPSLENSLLSDDRIQTVIVNKQINNKTRPDLIVFLKEPIKMAFMTIEKCFSIEVKKKEGFKQITLGIKQNYDNYDGQYYKENKIEKTFLLLVPLKNDTNTLYRNDNDWAKGIEFATIRFAWRFGIGYVFYNGRQLKFSFNEQDYFKISYCHHKPNIVCI